MLHTILIIAGILIAVHIVAAILMPNPGNRAEREWIAHRSRERAAKAAAWGARERTRREALNALREARQKARYSQL